MVSVIIPTFKRPDQLLKAVRSVINQTYNDVEIIVIDDDQSGNFDTTIDSRILYLKNSRKKGGNGSRNTGILAASGSYIAFLDDDDEWLPHKLQEQIEKLSKLDDSWGAIYCGWITENVIYNNHKEGNLLKDFLSNKVSIGASSTLLLKKDVLLKIGLWDESLIRHQDLDLLIRLLKQFKLAYLNSALVIVNGHNIPPYAVSKVAKANFFAKLKEELNDEPAIKYNHYIADHYRELAVFAAVEGDIKEVIYNIFNAYKSGFVAPYKFLSTIVYLANFYTLKRPFGKFKKRMAIAFSDK